MNARELISQFHDIRKAKDYASLKVFQSLPTVKFPPPPTQTFYLRCRGGSVYEIARDTVSGKLDPKGSVQERSYIPWDSGQLWCFLPANNHGEGLLLHPESAQYLTVKNGQLQWGFSYNYQVSPADYFKYTSSGEWVHVSSGYKLSYYVGCGMGHGHDSVAECYQFDLIPAYNVMSALLSNKIYWSNTNNNESLG